MEQSRDGRGGGEGCENADMAYAAQQHRRIVRAEHEADIIHRHDDPGRISGEMLDRRAHAEKRPLQAAADHDHGNAEEMMDLKTGELKTEHTSNPVPFYLIDKEFQQKNADGKYSFNVPQGILSDIAPTILEILKIPQPSEMTGMSLLEVLK